jgi:hypothetical protein
MRLRALLRQQTIPERLNMAIATIRIILETLDSAGKPANPPLVREVNLPPRLSGQSLQGNFKHVHERVTAMLDELRFGDAFERED